MYASFFRMIYELTNILVFTGYMKILFLFNISSDTQLDLEGVGTFLVQLPKWFANFLGKLHVLHLIPMINH
jgi:hypothetical protein